MIERKGVRVWEWGGAETRTLSHTPALLHSLAHARTSGLAAAMVLVAIILRIIPWLTNYPLHRDEALYGYWAQLIASGRDPLLLSPWVDKPPLVLYLLAADIRAFGASELALRLPGLIASLLLVLVTFGFARRAYGVRVALIAAGLLTLSPFAILFAPTAFTDPWLALWLVAAAWAALARRPFLAGLLLGLAVASKQQGVLGVPLVFALLAVGRWQIANSRWQMANRSPARHSAVRDLLSAVLGFALIFAPVTYWDSLRWVNRPSFWDRSVTTYGQLALAPLAEWPQRAADWATQIGYLFGLPVLSGLMLLIAAAVGVRAILALRAARWDRTKECLTTSNSRSGNAKSVILSGSTAQHPLQRTSSEESPDRERDSSLKVRRHALSVADPLRVTGTIEDTCPNSASLATRVDVILALYTAGYLALHFAATFQPWDRYLLPILPWICVLAARGLVLAWERFGGRSDLQHRLRAGLLVLVPALLYASWLGAAGRLPVGSDHGAYAGLDQAIALLRKQPADAVIYDRWLGWHYDFYLFDVPQERRWWGSGWKLADDAADTAQTEPARAQWVVLPDWESSAAEELHLPLASRGWPWSRSSASTGRITHARLPCTGSPRSARRSRHERRHRRRTRPPGPRPARLADPGAGDAGRPLAAGPDQSRAGRCGCAHLFHAVLGLSHGRAAGRADAVVESVSVPRRALPGQPPGGGALPAALAPLLAPARAGAGLVGDPPRVAGGRFHVHLRSAFAGPQPAGRVAGRADLRPGRVHAGSRREHQPAQRAGLAARAALAIR